MAPETQCEDRGEDGVAVGRGLGGFFAIHPHEGGTLAEMSFAESVLDASHAEAEG